MQTFETGARRGTDLAGFRYDLIPWEGLKRLAATCAEGAEKYGPHNWRAGIPTTDLLNHVLAHLVAYLSGDRSEDHLAHAAWGLFASMDNEAKRPAMQVGLLGPDGQFLVAEGIIRGDGSGEPLSPTEGLGDDGAMIADRHGVRRVLDPVGEPTIPRETIRQAVAVGQPFQAEGLLGDGSPESVSELIQGLRVRIDRLGERYRVGEMSPEGLSRTMTAISRDLGRIRIDALPATPTTTMVLSENDGAAIVQEIREVEAAGHADAVAGRPFQCRWSFETWRAAAYRQGYGRGREEVQSRPTASSESPQDPAWPDGGSDEGCRGPERAAGQPPVIHESRSSDPGVPAWAQGEFRRLVERVRRDGVIPGYDGSGGGWWLRTTDGIHVFGHGDDAWRAAYQAADAYLRSIFGTTVPEAIP